jgi:hypothetical protein
MGQIAWGEAGPRDAARRAKVKELLAAGQVRTGDDFERAALVFQHGDTPNDILMPHILAVTSLGKGNPDARRMSAMTLETLAVQNELLRSMRSGKELTEPGAVPTEPGGPLQAGHLALKPVWRCGATRKRRLDWLRASTVIPTLDHAERPPGTKCAGTGDVS